MPFVPVTDRIQIDEDELQLSFIRSSGPGGQNVNKVATAVQLRFDARRSPSLPNAVAIRLIRLAGKRATLEGEIVFTAQSFRTQEANRKDAIDRLVELIRQAAVPPKKRISTKPSKASKQRHLEKKKKRSDVKRGRQSKWD